MKNMTYLSLIKGLMMTTVFLFFTSCMNNLDREEVDLTNAEDRKTEMIYQQILETNEFETRRLLHKTLTNTEKINFWHHRINVLIKQGNYTESQLTFLQKTKLFITKVLTSQDEEDAGIIVPTPCAIAEAYFEEIPEELFSKPELVQMFALSKIGYTDNHLKANNGQNRFPVCECYSSTWDCSGNDKCSFKIDCVDQSSGCGIFGWCACKGMCF